MKLVHGGGRFAVAVAGLVMFAALLTVPPAYAGEVPQLAWLRQFGTPSNDRGFGVAVDASGVYVAGSTAGALPGQVSMGYDDAFVRKYDAAGTELWTRQFGTSDWDSANAVAVDPSGVYVAGSTYGTFPGQVSAGGSDAFVRKYDLAGTELWTRQFGTSGSDGASDIVADASGVYVAGYVDSGAFIGKYDADGNKLWTNGVSSLYSGPPVSVAVDASGVYLVGHLGIPECMSGTVENCTEEGTFLAPLPFLYKYDAFGNWLWGRESSLSEKFFDVAADASGVYIVGGSYLRRYDASGTEVWTSPLGTSDYDSASLVAVAVAAGPSGIYVAGYTEITSNGVTNSAWGDAFLRKYDANGSELGTLRFGTSDYDSAPGLAIDPSGVYVAGSTAGTFPGQVSAGGSDAFLARVTVSTVDDTSAPETTITSAVNGLGLAVKDGAKTTSPTLTFALAGSGASTIVGFECRLTRAGASPSAFAPCSSSPSFTLGLGTYTLEARAVDAAGHRDGTPATFTWSIRTAAQAMQDLKDMVNALVASGSLTKTQGTDLLASLDKASRDYAGGRILRTIEDLKGFNSKVESYIRAGTLTFADGRPMIDLGCDIIRTLGGNC